MSFTPLFGLHFVFAAALAWVMGGNMVAALLATFVGNPVTFPLIAAVSMEVGTWLLGRGNIPWHNCFEHNLAKEIADLVVDLASEFEIRGVHRQYNPPKL